MDKLLTLYNMRNLKPKRMVANTVITAIIRKNDTEKFCFFDMLFYDVQMLLSGPKMIAPDFCIGSEVNTAKLSKRNSKIKGSW